MVRHLPPSNPAAWELRGDTWGEIEWLLHDISSYARAHRTDDINRYRKKGSPEMELKLYPTPEERKNQVDERTPAQIQFEREHLQTVLARTRAQQAAQQPAQDG